MMNLKNESSLYGPIADWLTGLLASHFPRSTIRVIDSHKMALSALIRNLDYQKHFPNYTAFDIKVDITGFVTVRQTMYLVFVEVKIGQIKLLDVGQILGYSRVARPYLSLIISPSGCGTPLESLLVTYGRYDILEYDKGKMVRIVKWIPSRNDIDSGSILPRGESLL